MSSKLHVIGCDFSSRPSKKKPIVVAISQSWEASFLTPNKLKPPKIMRNQLSKLERFENLGEFSKWLQSDLNWVGGFDLPFGLPRELVETLGWPTDWLSCLRYYVSLSREEIRTTFKAFCAARPVGGKFAHRATDLPANSSPSMKWVNPPVAYMLYAGVPLLLDAQCNFPRLHSGNLNKTALEAYPGFLARSIIGNRSYKSDDKVKQTPERLIARKDILTALENGQTKLGIRLALSNVQRDELVRDASGDSLDAVLCMLQATWGVNQHLAGHKAYGLPKCDALEGWIVTV